MASHTIRQATPDDIDELLRLRQVMFDAMGVAPDESWHPACAAFLRDGFDAGTVAAFVASADADGSVVGGGVGLIHARLSGPGNPSGLFGYVQSMATDPAWRGRGIAGEIVDALLTWFTDNGVPTVDLHATAAGDPIYRKRGFETGRYPALRRSS